MILSDLSIKRPVVCLVASIIIVLVGLLLFARLPVREYPDIDPPIISIETNYPGASAEVVETKITEIIEKEVAAIDGIRIIRSSSSEQRSRIMLEFNVDRNLDEAANDVRDKVGRVRGRLPPEIDDPQISKADADADPVITLSFNSDRHSRLELTELVERLAVQRLQTIPGVASAGIRGQRYAMRLWVDPDRLAAYNLTVVDIDRALQQQNIDLPGGRIESLSREFPVRLRGRMDEPAEYENLVLATRNGYQVKFSDVGRVELGSEDYRSFTYFKGRPTVAVQVLRQSKSNLLEVTNAVKALIPVIQADVPEGVRVEVAFDNSVFVERSVREVYQTLWEAAGLVILMIFLFLRDWRATLIPLVAIPVSIIGSFAVTWLGFSLNILTLLALVLAVGLVVDDAIVMLENIYRRIEEGEEPIHAAIFGARQVAFAVIATTLTLVAVFVPVAFQSGRTGRLFYEFGLTLAV
jgi:multidrug efflux pump